MLRELLKLDRYERRAAARRDRESKLLWTEERDLTTNSADCRKPRQTKPIFFWLSACFSGQI